MAGNVKNDKMGFYRYVAQKRKMFPSINKTDELLKAIMEKAEVLNNFFASIFFGNHSSLKNLNLKAATTKTLPLK